jgi:DNA-binding MarR family transcriptional regulator
VDTLIEQVGELVEKSPEEIMERDKERGKVEARSMLCYWATDSLGISQGELAKRLELTQPAVSQAVRTGKIW